MIWLLIAVIATAVGLLLVLPVLRQSGSAVSDGLGVFAGQMAELERDRDLGLIEPDEARAAELDIKRRLLAAGDARSEAARGEARTWLRRTIFAASFAAVMAAVAVYILVGRPELVGAREPDRPAMPAEMVEVLAEIDALANDLMANPDNPRGWVVLGESYMALRRYGEAAIAFENAIDRTEPRPALFLALGQAHLFAEGGTMTPVAREAFARALDLDEDNAQARFWLAEADFQAGEREAAIAEWRRLLEEVPAEARYHGMIRTRLEAALADTEGETDVQP